ncbi:hypothetical protein FPV67DRAFT_1506500 [Lyophyllum atratum]|nr:hypothetical protein FPV67DRAFT_1506500 [Lyophyllum atratum]
MLDEDIQYIGTRPAQNVFSKDPFLQTPQIVTGIILRVEKSVDDPACVLTFHRSTSSVVHIGRRPSNEERVQTDSEGAMFRCAVVSRKHAKIAFSDSGHAYLIDMNSHHGTHIRKPGEAVSRMIKAETPTTLADGDVLTFGKSVGRHNEFVRPVVARVELIHSTGPESPFKPITPAKQTNHVDLTRSPPPRSSSGRYGVYVPNSPSSDNISSAMSDHDSDIEEIPASGANALPLQPRGRRSHEPESHLGRAFEALKRLLPPAHVPGALSAQESQPGGSRSPSHVWQPSPLVFDSPPQFDSPLYSPRSPPQWTDSPRFGSPNYRAGTHSPPFYAPSYDNPFSAGLSYGEINDFEDERHSQARSRSTSSMDLASPSPVSARRSISPEQEQPSQQEHNVVGAWPGSRSSSPERSSSAAPMEPPVNISEPSPAASSSPPPSISKAMSLGSICSEPHAQRVEIAEAPREESITLSPIEVFPEMKITKNEDNVLQTSLKKLQGEVAKLQTHRRKYKARFNTNVHLISDKLSDLDERVSDVNAQYTMLVDRVDGTDVDISDLQAQIDALRDQAEAFPAMSDEIMLHERSDVRASIETLRELVLEMRNLRESTQKQMSAELEAVRAARDAALATIAQHVEAQVCIIRSAADEWRSERLQTPAPALTPTATSLKRKRSDDEADEGIEGVRERVLHLRTPEDDGVVGASDAADVTMAEAAGPITSANEATTVCCHRDHDLLRPPPPKRLRRITTVAVQTATAVTVGAIVTWSALAFS